MNRKYMAMMMACCTLLITSPVFAVDPIASPVVVASISKLPDNGNVALTGTIEKAKGTDAFILGDGSGTVEVKITGGKPVVFKEGDKVSIIGSVDNGFFGLFGKTIDANYVQVQKGLTSSISDAIGSATGIQVKQAKSAAIAELPAQGMVKVSGTVDNVVSTKDFILKDTTGSIDVSIQSDENVALTKNAYVTVLGYVGNSALGNKSIRATRVIVADSATPDNTGAM